MADRIPPRNNGFHSRVNVTVSTVNRSQSNTPAADALADLAYLLAVRQGLLSLVAVVMAPYPAATILLARLVRGERTGRAQRVGLAVAAGAVALIAWAG